MKIDGQEPPRNLGNFHGICVIGEFSCCVCHRAGGFHHLKIVVWKHVADRCWHFGDSQLGKDSVLSSRFHHVSCEILRVYHCSLT